MENELLRFRVVVYYPVDADERDAAYKKIQAEREQVCDLINIAVQAILYRYVDVERELLAETEGYFED